MRDINGILWIIIAILNSIDFTEKSIVIWLAAIVIIMQEGNDED